MHSLADGYIERQPITQNLLQTVRALGEYRGKQALFKQQAPQVLDTLQQVAVVESTESSNRIEGVTAPPDRIRRLVSGTTTPQNRSEQEIAGYRDVLNTIHTHHDGIMFTPGIVLQLHRDLYGFVRGGGGGRWKRSTTKSPNGCPTAPGTSGSSRRRRT